MLTVRPRDETLFVTLVTVGSVVAVAASTHAWVQSALFGVLFVLRFALQPAEGYPLSHRRRAFLALLGCSALACLAWAIGVRVLHWPG